MRISIGFIIGLLIVYFIGAFAAWNFNIGEWHPVWRLWCGAWAIFWGCVGASVADEDM